MDCPKCNVPMEYDDDYCPQCYSWFAKCSVCDMMIEADKMESDICGHASCVEKKAERMFR